MTYGLRRKLTNPSRDTIGLFAYYRMSLKIDAAARP